MDPSWWVRPVRGLRPKRTTGRPASVPADVPTSSTSIRVSALAPAWERFDFLVRTRAPAARPEAAAGISSVIERSTPLSVRMRLRITSGNRASRAAARAASGMSSPTPPGASGSAQTAS